jgi:hypothetical protein
MAARTWQAVLPTATHHFLDDGAELLAQLVFEEFFRHNGCRERTLRLSLYFFNHSDYPEAR